MNYAIEVLQKEDIVLYKKLIDECFGRSNNIELYTKYTYNNNYKIFIIKCDNLIVGSVTQYIIDLFTFDFQPSLMLFNMAVLKEYRNKNIVTQLLNHVISQAKNNGYKSISLTCLDDAYPAHKLYESVGFKKTSNLKYNLTL